MAVGFYKRTSPLLKPIAFNVLSANSSVSQQHPPQGESRKFLWRTFTSVEHAEINTKLRTAYACSLKLAGDFLKGL